MRVTDKLLQQQVDALNKAAGNPEYGEPGHYELEQAYGSHGLLQYGAPTVHGGTCNRIIHLTTARECYEKMRSMLEMMHGEQGRLAKFGRLVLDILEKDSDWNSDTLAEIASVAANFDLADADSDGQFKAKVTL